MVNAASGDVGTAMYQVATELFPICRSLTGNGVRETLARLRQQLPALNTHEVPSGTCCLDWTVPSEWNIADAYLADSTGRRVIDFRVQNLHVVGYSTPVDQEVAWEELQPHLFSLPEQPDAIPYVTSYYKPFWGFCLTQRQRNALTPGTYRAVIRSTLAPGHLTYADLVLPACRQAWPGERTEEIFFSSYICHPSMANNELSGPVLLAFLAQRLQQRTARRYTYRFVWAPETIGSIVYLHRHRAHLRKQTIAGFQVTCVGDDRAYSYLPSRRGGTLADRVAQHVLRHLAPDYRCYSFLERGSDERQWCSPGVDLPLCSIMRSKYAAYPEYHTSLDDLSLISPAGFAGSFAVYTRCIDVLEHNGTYIATTCGEPQLGKRGLYPTLSTTGSADSVRTMMNLLAYADGREDLLAIAERLGVPMWKLVPLVAQFRHHELLWDMSQA